MASNAAAEITDRRQLPIVFNVYNHARRAEFKHLPSESNRSWRTVPVDRPAYAMPPAPHDSYADFVAGRMSATWTSEELLRSRQCDAYFSPDAARSSEATASDAARDEISAAYHAREEIERSWRRISSRAFPRRSKWTAEALLQ
jgi:hypothetical protein